MKLFKFTLLMAGILLCGSMLGQSPMKLTPPEMKTNVQKGIGFGADPDLYRIFDTNVIDISVTPGDYGDSIVSLGFVIKKDGKVIDDMSKYGSMSIFLPGTGNYNPTAAYVFPDTTFQVLSSQGTIPGKEFCFNKYQDSFPDGLSLNLLRFRKLRLFVVWNVPGTYTIEWVLSTRNTKDTLYDIINQPITHFIHLATNIYESFNTKPGNTVMFDTMTMVLKKPVISFDLPDTIDNFDSIPRPLYTKANSYIDQKGYVYFQLQKYDDMNSDYVNTDLVHNPDGTVGILSENSSANKEDKYSIDYLESPNLIGASLNGSKVTPEGILGKYDSLTKTVFTEMFEEGKYRMIFTMYRSLPTSVDLLSDEFLVADTTDFVVKHKIRPTVVFYPNGETSQLVNNEVNWHFEDTIKIARTAEFFGSVEFKANDFADTTGKISYVVKKDGREINPAEYGYLRIGDKVFTQANYAYPVANTFLLGNGDTTLSVDAKWNQEGLYEIYAYEDHYVNGNFRRHLAGDTLRIKVDGRSLPFLWMRPHKYPDEVPNYTKNAYYWFDLMKDNGDFGRAYVDLKFEIAYSTDSLNWDTVGLNFDDYGFMTLVPQLYNNPLQFLGMIPEQDTLHTWTGSLPMNLKKLTGSDVIRLQALDSGTKVDIKFKQAGYYRIVYSFEQWSYPNQGNASIVGTSSKYNAVPYVWLSHDTTIFHIHDSILPSAEVIPAMAHMGTDIDYHVGVRMDAGSYQYPEYTDWAYIKYELSKKDENGNYQPVTDVASCGSYTLTHRNGTLEGTTGGKMPSWNGAYLLEKLHNDTLGIDFRCNRDAAGDYAMHVQVIQYHYNPDRFPLDMDHQLRYPTTALVNDKTNIGPNGQLRYIGEDSIRHGLLLDTIFYVTFDSLINPELTLTPSLIDPDENDCYVKDADYYFNATVDANDYTDSIVSLKYSIYYADPQGGMSQITNVSDYGTFVINSIPVSSGTGILPNSPVALPQTKTVPVEINWKKEGLYTFIYEFVGYAKGASIITYVRDTMVMNVCSKEKPSFVILPDPVYSNDSNGFGDDFYYRFVSRVYPGDLGYLPAWLITTLSYEDVNTGVITPIAKLSDYNAEVSFKYNDWTHNVVNGVDTMGNETLPLSAWAMNNIQPVMRFPQVGNYHLNMRLYQVKDGMGHAKFIDTTIIVRVRDVDSITLNTDEIQNHINNSLVYTTHVDSIFNIVFKTSDRFVDTIDPYVSLEYRVIYEDFQHKVKDTIEDFSEYGHLKVKIGDQILSLTNGSGSIPGDAVEMPTVSSIRLKDLYKDTIKFIPNVHPQGFYTFEFFVKEWRDTLGNGPVEYSVGSQLDSVLLQNASMDVAIISRMSGFTATYYAKWPTVDMIATNEDSIVQKDFNKYPINCGEPYKTGVLYTFDFICHPNSYPDSLAGLFFQIYKDGMALTSSREVLDNIDSLSLTFRGITVNIAQPQGNLATLFTGIDSVKLGRIYDPVTGDITPIHMAVKWKPGATGKYMATGLVLEYINGKKTMYDLASHTAYFVVKDNPVVEVTTPSVYGKEKEQVVLDNEKRMYGAYDTLEFNFDINAGTYDTNYASLDLVVSYQKDSNSTPIIIDTLSKIGATADYMMDILGRTNVAPKVYAVNAVKSIPMLYSQDVVGKDDSLKSILLKYLAGNTITFRPYLTEAGIYNFTFSLKEWDSVTNMVDIEGELNAGGVNGYDCYTLWQESYFVEIVPPTISVDPVFPQVTTYTDSVDYPFFINTTKGSYDSLNGYVHYKIYHLIDENGVKVDTAITNLDAYGKMKFEHPVHGTRYYAPNCGEGNVPALDSLYKLQQMLTDIMWYNKGTYRIVYSLDIVPENTNIPLAYDTLDMEVGEKIKPTFVISNFDPTSNYPTNIDQDFDLRLISNDYLFDYGDIQYIVKHNDTIVDEKSLNSVYGDVNVDVRNLDLCGIPFDGNFSMRSQGRLPGQRGGIDFFRLGLFDGVQMNINANFKEPGEYKIIFNLLARDTANSVVLCSDQTTNIMNAGAKGQPTYIITRDSLIIHVVDRPNLPIITILPQHCDTSVVVPTNIEQVYQVLVDTNDWADMSATIRYEIKYNGNPITSASMANYGTMKVSKNGVVGNVTESNGFLQVGPVTNVPMRTLQDADLKTYLNFTIPGEYTMVYSLYGWGDSINKAAVYFSTDSITLKVADRVMPTVQTTLYAGAHPTGVQDTFKVYLHSAEYEHVMGRVAFQVFHSPDSGKTLNPISKISDFGSASVRFDAQAIGYPNVNINYPFRTYMDTLPYARFVRLGAVSGIPVEIITNWDSAGTYVFAYEIIQWDCYDSNMLDPTTFQHRPIYGNIVLAGGQAVHVLYRDTLMMHVYPRYAHVEASIELCANELPYEYNGTGYYIPASFNKDVNGEVIMESVRDTLVLPLKTVHGMDSIVYLDVQVHPVYEFTYVDTLRGLGAYNNHGFAENFNMPGHYTLRAVYPTIHGCDSVIVDSLLVVPTYSYTENIAVCSDQIPYTWHNQQLTVSGDYYDSLLSVYGADSVYSLKFTVNPAYYYYDTITVPMWNTVNVYKNVPTVQLPYTYAIHNGASYVCNHVGDYVFNFKTINGCDSIAYVNVKTYDMMHTLGSLNGNRSNDQIFCYGDAVTMNIDVDTTYGANSVVYGFVNSNPNIGLATSGVGNTVNFTATNMTNIPQKATIVMGAAVKHEGNRNVDVYEYYTGKLGGMPASTEVLADSSLCTARPDTIHVTVLPLYEYFDTLTVCSSELPYEWQGQYLTTSGTHEVTYKSVIGGCDSTYHMYFTINPAYYYYDTITIPTWNTANAYNNIPTVKLPYTYAVHNGTSYVCDATGDFEFNFKTINGCDSIAYVYVKTYPMMHTQGSLNGNRDNEQTLCYGENVVLDIAVDSTYDASNIVFGFVNNNPNIGLANAGTSNSTSFVAINNTNIPQEATIIMEAAVRHDGSRTVEVYEKYSGSLGGVAVSTETLTDSSICVARPDTIHVTVLPLYDFYDTATICSNEPLMWQGALRDVANDYVEHYHSLVGNCDSIYHLHLNVNPAYLRQVDGIEICASELPYEYNNSGRYIPESIIAGAAYGVDVLDTVVFNFKTVEGCDSIVYVGVLVHPLYTTTMRDTLCGLGIYAKNGFNQVLTTPGINVLSRVDTTAYGCDSLVVDTVIVSVPFFHMINATVCSNETYTWRNKVLSVAGVYYDSLKNMYGCDSVFALTLNVNPAYLHQVDGVEICASELPYEYNNSGMYIPESIIAGAAYGTDVMDTVVFNFKTVEGCDSIVYVGVLVHPLYTTTMRDTLCGLGIYAKNGFNQVLTTPGVNILSRVDRSVYGCDSLVVDTVIVSVPFFHMVHATICSNETYDWRGYRALSADSIYYDSLKNQYGCDSVFALTLHVNPAYLHQVDGVEICASELPYNFNNSGKYITATPAIQLNLLNNKDARDTFKFHYYTTEGCDSIVYVAALVHPTFMTVLPTDTACIGAYNNHGFSAYFKTPGIYPLSRVDTTAYGCDSTVNVSVFVAPNYYTKVNESICAGVPYVNHGFSFVKDTAGTYAFRFDGKTTLGCDSIIDVELEVYPSYSKPSGWTHLYPSVCRGETYSQNGFYVETYKLPANKRVHNDTNVYKTINGCDSVVHLQLTINDTVVTRFNASICLGERYAQNGFSVKPTSAGVFEYQNARRTSNGCDSTAILTLTVNQVYNTTYYDEVCEGEHYQKYGFNTIVTANGTRLTQNYNTQRACGCDSIVTVVLTVHPKSATNTTDYICRTEGAYNKNGFHVVLPATLKNIVVRDTLHNYYGCDSISTLYLTIYDGSDTAITANVCEGERYHSFGFDTTIYVPGMYHFSHKMKNMNGCDSNITLTLTVKPVYTSYETVSICEGDSVNYNGVFYGKGTHKIAYAHSAACCDSTLYLTVNTNPIVRETVSAKVCRNVQSSYVFNGKTISQTGTYTDTVPFNGCIKIVTLNLTFLDTAARPTSISGPMNIYTAGVYNYTCDTVPYNPNAGVPAVDAYLWETSDTTWTIVSSNMNTANINIPKPGSGFVFVSSHNECGYSSRTSLKVFAKVSVEDIEGSNNAEVSIFPNPTNAEYSIRINGMEGKTQISIADVTGKVVFRENVEISAMDNTIHYNAENYPKGVYMISILNGNKSVVKKLIVQ